MIINRREFMKSAGIGLGSVAWPEGATRQDTEKFDPLNEKGRHPILDRDFPYVFIDSCMQAWPDARYQDAHRHGVTVYAVTAWDPHLAVDRALEGLMGWHLVARMNPGLEVVTSADVIPRLKEQGRAGLLLASQCGDFIHNHIHRLEAFYRLGLRMLIPAYSAANQICGGCLDVSDGGLTALGRTVVRECNRIGLLLDGSHLGRRSSLEIIERSEHPIIFSHSGVRSLSENPRNIDDDQIRACAAKGGVIGLSPWGPMVMKSGVDRRPTLDDFIDHIDFVAQTLGSTLNIGVGTDMSLGTYPDHARNPWGMPEYRDVTGRYDRFVTDNIRSPRRMVEGFSNYAEARNLVVRLKSRGYHDEDVRSILGGNYSRVFKQVWK